MCVYIYHQWLCIFFFFHALNRVISVIIKIIAFNIKLNLPQNVILTKICSINVQNSGSSVIDETPYQYLISNAIILWEFWQLFITLDNFLSLFCSFQQNTISKMWYPGQTKVELSVRNWTWWKYLYHLHILLTTGHSPDRYIVTPTAQLISHFLSL